MDRSAKSRQESRAQRKVLRKRAKVSREVVAQYRKQAVSLVQKTKLVLGWSLPWEGREGRMHFEFARVLLSCCRQHAGAPPGLPPKMRRQFKVVIAKVENYLTAAEAAQRMLNDSPAQSNAGFTASSLAEGFWDEIQVMDSPQAAFEHYAPMGSVLGVDYPYQMRKLTETSRLAAIECATELHRLLVRGASQ